MSQFQVEKSNNMWVDIWKSFMRLPNWVKVWMMLVLAPINLLSLAFLNQPHGQLVAFLSILGMVPAVVGIFAERGFSRSTAVSHIIPWTILVGYLIAAKPEVTGIYDCYLTALLVISIISLIFDYPQTYEWLKGLRDVF